MRRKDVKTIIAYFYGIPAQRRLLDQERAELEAEYNGLRGTSYDGMPHSSTPGKPVETLAERADAGTVWGKLGITERTAKRWGERALDRLGEALEEVSMPDEILSRASRARV